MVNVATTLIYCRYGQHATRHQMLYKKKSYLISNITHPILHHLVQHSNLSGGNLQIDFSSVYISDREIFQICLDSLIGPLMYSTVKDNNDYAAGIISYNSPQLFSI